MILKAMNINGRRRSIFSVALGQVSIVLLLLVVYIVICFIFTRFVLNIINSQCNLDSVVPRGDYTGE